MEESKNKKTKLTYYTDRAGESEMNKAFKVAVEKTQQKTWMEQAEEEYAINLSKRENTMRELVRKTTMQEDFDSSFGIMNEEVNNLKTKVMYKFRKKPIVIEAFQMTEERRENNSEWPEWLNAAWQMSRHDEGAVFPEGMKNNLLCVNTLEGIMTVGRGDYIIQGIQGELYPCKAKIFEATYEKVE